MRLTPRLARAMPAHAVLLAFVLAWSPGARAQGVVPHGFQDVIVHRGMNHPVGMAFLPDGRLIVVEQTSARIRMLVKGILDPVDLMTVDSVATDFFEQGLLGVAVDPGWPERPYVYAYHDAVDSTMRIARYRASGDLDDGLSGNLTLDPASKYDVLRDIPDRELSHNAGTLRFGPDGMLYTALADDWERCAAQDSVSLRGVLLRLDVSGLPDGPGGPAPKSLLAPPDNPWPAHPNENARLVWAIGFRNPFRFHIDPITSEIFVGDVGSGGYEEIDLVDGPGLDFGWPFFEGHMPYMPSCPAGAGAALVPPIHVDDRRFRELASIISAGVYRPVPGDYAFPAEYDGDYFYADYYAGHLRRLKRGPSGWSVADSVAGQPSAENWGAGFIETTDFLVGPDAALWYIRTTGYGLDHTGEIRRILYFVPSTADVPGSSATLRLAPPSPSPARGRVRLGFELARPGTARLEILDAAGRRVRTLAAGFHGAGAHVAHWDGRDDAGRTSPAGVYFVRLGLEDVSERRRFVMLR